MEKNSSAGDEDQNQSVGSPGEKTTEARPQEELTIVDTPVKKTIQVEPSTDVISAATVASDAPAAAILNGTIPANEPATPSGTVKNPAAVSLGRLGGLKGGKARAEALTKRERSEAARKAARARWRKREKAK